MLGGAESIVADRSCQHSLCYVFRFQLEKVSLRRYMFTDVLRTSTDI